MQNATIISFKEDVHLKADSPVKSNKGKNSTKYAQTEATHFLI